MRWLALVLLLWAGFWPGASHGEPVRWRVTLAGVTLGQLGFTATPDGPTLSTLVDNTPMGVFNGSFAASATRGPDGTLFYTSSSRTTRKVRDISFAITAQGQVQGVEITPDDQRTALSDASKVPQGVVDPASAFARFVSPAACPEGFALYDGRRVVTVSHVASQQTPARLTCQMRYDITAGPGHLSPLYLTHFRLWLEYTSLPDGALILDRVKMRGGVFTLRLTRQ